MTTDYELAWANLKYSIDHGLGEQPRVSLLNLMAELERLSEREDSNAAQG